MKTLSEVKVLKINADYQIRGVDKNDYTQIWNWLNNTLEDKVVEVSESIKIDYIRIGIDYTAYGDTGKIEMQIQVPDGVDIINILYQIEDLYDYSSDISARLYDIRTTLFNTTVEYIDKLGEAIK